MKIIKLFYIISLIFITFMSGISCDSGIGDDLRETVEAGDCSIIDDLNFNVTDGIETEWGAIDPDTILDNQNDVNDPDLDIIYANFVYNSGVPTLQFYIALRGVPNTAYGYLMQINQYTLVIEYTTLWEATLFNDTQNLGPETVTSTLSGLEGELINLPGMSSGENLTIYVSGRDASLAELDKTERRCITLP